jgi:hypothetical protein
MAALAQREGNLRNVVFDEFAKDLENDKCQAAQSSYISCQINLKITDSASVQLKRKRKNPYVESSSDEDESLEEGDKQKCASLSSFEALVHVCTDKNNVIRPASSAIYSKRLPYSKVKGQTATRVQNVSSNKKRKIKEVDELPNHGSFVPKMFSRIPKVEQEDMLKVYLHGISGDIYTNIYNRVQALRCDDDLILVTDYNEATHFVLSKTPPNRTPSLVMAIALGLPIIQYEWFEQLLANLESSSGSDLISTDHQAFLILAYQQSVKELFSDYTFDLSVYRSRTSPNSAAWLKTLLELCGGQVISGNQKSTTTMTILPINTKTNGVIQNATSAQWVYDCILRQSL